VTLADPAAKASLFAASLLDFQAAAAYLGLSASFLAKRRLFGDGPVYAKFGRRVLYAQQDLDDWRSAHLRRSTSAAGRP
jgi:hypothetical protein